MFDFPIVDTHVHLWDTRRFAYPWLDGIPSLNRPFLIEDYDAARGDIEVESMVFMQCDVEVSRSMDEAAWIAELAESEPRLGAIIPWAPVGKGEGSRPVLDTLKASPLVKGVRRLLQTEADPDFCTRPDFLTGLRVLEEYDYSFDICLSRHQMPAAIAMVKQHEKVVFILDHIGKPDIASHEWEPWAGDVKALAELPNVHCKISGMITEADHDKWTKEDLAPYITHVIECFGFDRILYGGDWPVVTLAGKYTRWFHAIEWVLRGCSRDELRKLFRNNARTVYKMEGL